MTARAERERGGWREDRLHAWLLARTRPARLVGSWGHDGAVLTAHRGRLVLCADQTVEGVHAERGVPGRALARKAVARTISDLAACGAVPREVLLCLAAPRSRSAAWMRAALRGAAERAEELGAELVGGDLACAPGGARLSVTAVGELPGRRRPPGRDRVRPGQVLLATGPFGGSRLGRHLEPEPRLAEGRWLFEHGATALMDVSDGLALDASRLARRSGVALELLCVPIHRDARRAARASGRSARHHALTDGEDYELLAAVDERSWRRVSAAARERFPRLVVVGRARAGSGLRVADESGELVAWRGAGGWIHG